MAIPFERIVAEDLNVGVGTVTVTMPAGGSALGTQINAKTFGIVRYNVRDYGAIGDGHTDDTAACQAAITAAQAAGGGLVWVPNGTYRLTTDLTVTLSNVMFQGETRSGAVLQWDDLANYGLFVETAAVDPVSSALTADAAIGARSITVGNGALFPVGAWVFLQSTTGSHTSALVTRVHSAASNVLTLEDAVPALFAVAAGATLYGYVAHPLLTGLIVRDLTFQCVTQTPTSMLTLLELNRCNNFRVDNCAFRGSTAPLLNTVVCYRGHVAHCVFENAITVAGAGVAFTTSTGCCVADSDVTMCQFGITPSQAPYTRLVGNRINGRATNVALGRGIRCGDGSNFSAVSGNTLSDMNLYGIYIQDSAYCAVTGNTVAFLGDFSSNTGEHGIVVGGFVPATLALHNTVSGNVVTGSSGYGIAILGFNDTDAHAVVTGNASSGNLWGALYCDGSHCVLSGNQLSGAGATTIGGLMRFSVGGDNNTVVGNVFVCEDGVATFAINSTGGGGHNVFDDNILGPNLTNSFNAGDTIGASQAYVNARLPAINLNSFAQVSTPANTVETTAWTFTIPGNTLTTAGQGFRLRAVIGTGANANLKYIRVKVGATAVFLGTLDQVTGSAQQVLIDLEAFFVNSSSVYLWCTYFASQLDSLLFEPGASYFNASDDWTQAVTVSITIQNAVASAGDLTFRAGKLVYENVPHG